MKNETHPTKLGRTVVLLLVVAIGGVPPVPGRGPPVLWAAASWGNDVKNGPAFQQQQSVSSSSVDRIVSILLLTLPRRAFQKSWRHSHR